MTGQSDAATAAQLADTNRDINNATTISRDTSFDTGNIFIDVGAARRVSDNLETINESFDLIIERPLTGPPLDITKEDQTILKRISDFFKNSTSVNDSNNTETSSQSVNNGVFTYTRDVFNEDGSVIQVSIDLKAFNVTQEQADDFLADLPNEFLVRYNGTSFVDNYRPTQWYSFANEEASWSGHDTSRDLISIGYQISDILTPEEGFGDPQSVLFGIVGGTSFGQQPEDDILITQNAIESGVTQVIATIIHERAHLWDTNRQGGYYDLSLRRHQEIYNEVYGILTDTGFDPNSFNMRRDLFPEIAVPLP